MAIALSFYALHDDTRRDDIINAYHDHLAGEDVNWETNARFGAFCTELRQEFETLGCSDFILNTQHPGVLKLELSGSRLDKAHDTLGKLLMLHRVVSYNPQLGELLLELEPFK